MAYGRSFQRDSCSDVFEAAEWTPSTGASTPSDLWHTLRVALTSSLIKHRVPLHEAPPLADSFPKLCDDDSDDLNPAQMGGLYPRC